MTEKNVADTGEQGKYAEEHFIKPPAFLEPWSANFDL
jgi:hypothetical protein